MNQWIVPVLLAAMITSVPPLDAAEKSVYAVRRAERR